MMASYCMIVNVGIGRFDGLGLSTSVLGLVAYLYNDKYGVDLWIILTLRA